MSISTGWILIMAVLLAVGMPIAFAVILSGIVAITVLGAAPLRLIPIMMFQGINSFLLIAVPLFLLVGKIMEAGGTAKMIFDSANTTVGWVRGGMGHVNIIGSMIFGGISGSSVADAGSLGRIATFAMYRTGYPKNYSAGLSVVASTLAIIIPPSVPMVIYAVSASESVGRLLASGLVPGIFVGLVLMLIHYGMCLKRGWEYKESFSFATLLRTFRRSFWALLTPFVILGTIFSGIVTATEGAAVAVLYCFLISTVIYGEMGWATLWGCIKESARDSGAILFMISAASLVSYLLAADRVPQNLAEWVIANSPGPAFTISGIIVLLLIAGMLMDPASAIIILVPVLVPVAKQIGYNSVHFGLIFVVTMAIGLITPPVAPCLMVTCQVTDTRMEDVIVECLPFILGMIAALGVLIAFPSLSLWFPNLLFGK